MPIDGRIYKSAPTTQSAVLSDGVVVEVLHKQSFIHKIYANGRGGLACPPVTRCVCTNNHSSIKFMQTVGEG